MGIHKRGPHGGLRSCGCREGGPGLGGVVRSLFSGFGLLLLEGVVRAANPARVFGQGGRGVRRSSLFCPLLQTFVSGRPKEPNCGRDARGDGGEGARHPYRAQVSERGAGSCRARGTLEGVCEALQRPQAGGKSPRLVRLLLPPGQGPEDEGGRVRPEGADANANRPAKGNGMIETYERLRDSASGEAGAAWKAADREESNL